jgi:spore germination protein GerM
VAHELYLVNDDRRVRTVRRFEERLNAQQQLDQLVAGPTAAEQARGLSTALGAIKLRVKQPITGATAEVEVETEAEKDEEGAARTDEVLVYGQIVCTLTSRADVAAVTFFRDGQQLRVPRGDLVLSGAPLRAADFGSLTGPA